MLGCMLLVERSYFQGHVPSASRSLFLPSSLAPFAPNFSTAKLLPRRESHVAGVDAEGHNNMR